MEGIDHLDLVVSDLERSLAWYRGLLEPLGWHRVTEIEGERGERVVYLGRSGMGSISLRQAQSPVRAYDRYELGLHHLALRAPSREVVDERAAWLREQGSEIESGPQEHDYTPGYYAVFFRDPDGLKLEVLHRPD